MPRSERNWATYFKRSDRKNIVRRKALGEKVKEPAPSTFSGMVLPRVVGDPPIFVRSYSKSHIAKHAAKRRANPIKAEAELRRILNSLNGGVLQGRFQREHVVSGKWIVDFFFPEIRLVIEVNGSAHNTKV